MDRTSSGPPGFEFRLIGDWCHELHVVICVSLQKRVPFYLKQVLRIHGRGDLPSSWLVLLAQLSSKPSSARVAIWRRMRAAGATPVVNGAWMLPRMCARDFFEQCAKELSAGRYRFVLQVSGYPRNNESSCSFSSPTGPVNMTSSRSAAPLFSMKLTGSPRPRSTRSPKWRRASRT